MTGPPSTNLIRGVWDRSPAHRQWTQRFLLAFNFFDFLAADSAASSKFSNRSLSVSSRTTSGTSAILSVAVPTVCVRWPLQGRAKTLRSTIPVLRSTAITICCCCNLVLRIILSNQTQRCFSENNCASHRTPSRPPLHQNPCRTQVVNEFSGESIIAAQVNTGLATMLYQRDSPSHYATPVPPIQDI